MAAIKSLLNELTYEMFKVIVLNAFLDGVIFFLALLLVLSVFGMGLTLPALASIIFVVADVWWHARRISLRYIEEKNPDIREMLRTAADNKEDDSLMAHALFDEVISRARRVSSGTFLDFRKLSTKIGALFVLSMVLVSLAFFNVNIQKFENPLAGFGGTLKGYWDGITGQANFSNPGLKEGDDILGDPSIAKLGNEQLDITLQQNLNQIDFSNVQSADPSASGDLKDYPTGVEAKASEAYTGGLEDITDRKTAADYSQQIRR